VREADLLKCQAARITHLNICDSLLYYQPNTLAGAINNFFIAYPQKYENCSTLATKRDDMRKAMIDMKRGTLLATSFFQ
jgi:hypothetical protein